MKKILAFTTTALLLSTIAASAQQQTTSSTSFDNWVMNCTAQIDKDNKQVKGCELRTTLMVKDEKSGQEGVGAVVSVGRLMSEKTLQGAVQLPIAARLDVPVKVIGSDNKPIVDLPYMACQPQLCTAGAALTDTQVTALRKTGDKFSISYRNQAGQDVKLDVVTKGLGAALDAVAKEK